MQRTSTSVLPSSYANSQALTENRAPHIVHVTECLAGGTLGFLIHITRELSKMGVQQTLVYARRPDSPAEVATLFPRSVHLVELPPASGNHVRFVMGLRAQLSTVVRDQLPVAVHFHSSKAGFAGRFVLAMLKERPACYYSPHGLSFLNGRRLISSAVYYVLEKAAGFVHHTPVGCGKSEAALLERLTRRAAFILENPVSEDFFALHRTETSQPTVISIGRACEQKAPERFAELSLKFQIEESPVQFVWVGSGEAAREDLLKAACVKVTGWVGSEEVKHWLSTASVYVQTSRWEGMPLSVLQAMAAGLPCVVTDVVGNRDAIRHGETGFVAKNDAEILEYVRLLLADDALRKRLGIAARLDAQQRFGPEPFRRSLRRLYQLNPIEASR
ncbi:MAG: glycosyltransferase [Burkholderiaceae bacterium]